jgi:hypothetical protein
MVQAREGAVMTGTAQLFEPTIEERLHRLEAFVREEHIHRLRMVDRHPEKRDYWQGRVDQTDAALRDLSAVKAAVAS